VVVKTAGGRRGTQELGLHLLEGPLVEGGEESATNVGELEDLFIRAICKNTSEFVWIA
jgi:hypothetical protein